MVLASERISTFTYFKYRKNILLILIDNNIDFKNNFFKSFLLLLWVEHSFKILSQNITVEDDLKDTEEKKDWRHQIT